MSYGINEKHDDKEKNDLGNETWQTKANAKNTVPRYYSPTELLAMRVDKLEAMVLNLNERLSNISSDHLRELKKEDYEYDK